MKLSRKQSFEKKLYKLPSQKDTQNDLNDFEGASFLKPKLKTNGSFCPIIKYDKSDN